MDGEKRTDRFKKWLRMYKYGTINDILISR